MKGNGAIKCFYLFKDCREIKKLDKPLKLNKRGEEKIKQIVHFIGKLQVNYLETQYQLSTRILEETKVFPFIELLPVILEILISQNLKPHQVYFCLKIFQNLKFCSNHHKVDSKDENYEKNYTLRYKDTLLKIYFKYLTYFMDSTFVLEVLTPYKDDLVFDCIEKKINTIIEAFGILKFLNYFDKNNKDIFKRIIFKINSLTPRNEIEREIKNVLK